MFADFDQYQQRIRRALDRGDTLLAAEVPDVTALGTIRWELVQAVRAYQVYKHSEIFDPLIDAGIEPAALIARGMKAMCIAASSRGKAFILEWSGRSAGDDWPRYSAATLAMNAEVRLTLEIERMGLTELRAAVAGGPVHIRAIDRR